MDLGLAVKPELNVFEQVRTLLATDASAETLRGHATEIGVSVSWQRRNVARHVAANLFWQLSL
jgi:ribosomal protein S18 acetylase RimI-like enzyme